MRIHTRGHDGNEDFIERITVGSRQKYEQVAFDAVSKRGYGHCVIYEVDDNTGKLIPETARHFLPRAKDKQQ